MNSTALIYIICAAAFSCIGNVFIKFASNNSGAATRFYEIYLNPYFILGVCCFLLNLILFSQAIRTVPVALAYPILSTLAFVTLNVVSINLLGERLQFHQYLGIAVALGGVALMSAGSGK